jgi:hypothetical protein
MALRFMLDGWITFPSFLVQGLHGGDYCMHMIPQGDENPTYFKV